MGTIAYGEALAWQRRVADRVRRGECIETLALLDHPPVFTAGARGSFQNLLADPREITLRGADLVRVDRGGDITFHGPGQLVAYPIIDLHTHRMGARRYVYGLEAAIVATVGRFGVTAGRRAGYPGVWVDGAKVAAVGIRISRGVTTHGVAINVTTELSWFDAIVPCGIPGVRVTSLERILGRAPDLNRVADAFAQDFAAAFNSRIIVSDGGLATREKELALDGA